MRDNRKPVTKKDILKRKIDLYKVFCSKIPNETWIGDDDTNEHFPKLQEVDK